MKKSSTVRFALMALAGAGVMLTPAAHAEKLLLLTSENRLLTIDSAAPAQVLSSVAITGIPIGETLLGIDVRPKDGTLFALSSASRLYILTPSTGASAIVGTAPFTPALNGTSFGFDFNPTVDRIRVVSNTRQNLRLNPDTGAVAATDGPETYGANDVNAALTPTTTAAAYTNNGPNATVTQLYVIDTTAGVLALQNPPNAGTLVTVNPLGVAPEGGVSGFDISNVTERGYAVFTVAGVPTLYAINLAGAPNPPGTPVTAATSLGALPAGTYTGLTVPPVIPTTVNAVRRANAEAFVEKGKPMFMGFTIGAAGPLATDKLPVRVVIRGLGPSLGDDGVPNPALRVFDSQGVKIANNDNFPLSPTAAQITALGLAPLDPQEAAVMLTLEPGDYSVRLNAKTAEDAGTGRIEVIDLLSGE